MLRTIALVVGGIVVGSGAAVAAPVQWTVGSGGNDHYYERVDQTGLTFAQAEAAAEGLSFNGLPGRLAIFEDATYTAERNFVFNSVYSPGVTSNRMYWVGATLPAGGSVWSWIDGNTVPTAISNTWNVDHFEGAGDEGAGFFNTGANTLYDYIQSNSSNAISGYIVEYATAVPEPASLSVMMMVGTLLVRRRRRA